MVTQTQAQTHRLTDRSFGALLVIADPGVVSGSIAGTVLVAAGAKVSNRTYFPPAR